jgi:hypothetical protein
VNKRFDKPHDFELEKILQSVLDFVSFPNFLQQKLHFRRLKFIKSVKNLIKLIIENEKIGNKKHFLLKSFKYDALYSIQTKQKNVRYI